MTAVEVARVAAKVDEHDRRFEEVRTDLNEATKALWAAVEALRARPQVHPIATAIISTLTAAVGVLSTLALR